MHPLLAPDDILYLLVKLCVLLLVMAVWWIVTTAPAA